MRPFLGGAAFLVGLAIMGGGIDLLGATIDRWPVFLSLPCVVTMLWAGAMIALGGMAYAFGDAPEADPEPNQNPGETE